LVTVELHSLQWLVRSGGVASSDSPIATPGQGLRACIREQPGVPFFVVPKNGLVKTDSGSAKSRAAEGCRDARAFAGADAKLEHETKPVTAFLFDWHFPMPGQEAKEGYE